MSQYFCDDNVADLCVVVPRFIHESRLLSDHPIRYLISAVEMIQLINLSLVQIRTGVAPSG
jgi:hypothetical protein